VTGPGDEVLVGVCNAIRSGGGTDLAGGLIAGYALAEANYDTRYLNRVILVSDGQANIGITDETIIAGAAEDTEGEGIYLVGVGVGKGYNDTLMDAVTDAGKGAYVFIDTRAEAEKIFGDRFVSTLDIAVMDVRVELTLPTWLRIEEFHGEEISTDPAEVEPQHLAPNDAMIYHQLVKACEEPPLDDVITAIARYTDRYSRVRQSDGTTVTIADLLASQADPQLVKGTAIVAYAEGLKEISEYMDARDHASARDTCESVLAELDAASLDTSDPELAEIASLMALYCSNLTSRHTTPWY
jgi:Ca-activated chloride channel family protein